MAPSAWWMRVIPHLFRVRPSGSPRALTGWSPSVTASPRLKEASWPPPPWTVSQRRPDPPQGTWCFTVLTCAPSLLRARRPSRATTTTTTGGDGPGREAAEPAGGGHPPRRAAVQQLRGATRPQESWSEGVLSRPRSSAWRRGSATSAGLDWCRWGADAPAGTATTASTTTAALRPRTGSCPSSRESRSGDIFPWTPTADDG
jgi:hypothetical protein